MSERLVVNFAALQQASLDINNAINSMRTQLDDANDSAKPLVSTWDGGARDAYQQRQDAWTRAANDLTAMLTEIKKAVDESASQYQQTEDRNTRLFQ